MRSFKGFVNKVSAIFFNNYGCAFGTMGLSSIVVFAYYYLTSCFCGSVSSVLLVISAPEAECSHLVFICREAGRNGWKVG